MTFKTFIHSGSWLQRARIYLNYKLRGYYIANSPVDVPFYTQQKANGDAYQLPSGTKCYIADLQIVVELRKDRWYALGDSLAAKNLNNEIDYYVDKSELTPEQLLAEMRRYINQGNQSIADQIIQNELDKAGIVIGPMKDFNN